MTIKVHRQINSGGDVRARSEAKTSKPVDKSLRHSFFPTLSNQESTRFRLELTAVAVVLKSHFYHLYRWQKNECKKCNKR